MHSLQLKNIEKVYRTGKLAVPVLNNVNLEVEKGEMVAIMGPSGSGKSTMMNIIGLLDRPTKGEVFLGEESINLEMSDKDLAKLRSEKIGFVFQSFQLLPRLTALHNVLLPSLYRKSGQKDRLKRAQTLLEGFGLGERSSHYPSELSGGEKQRVAIARALINDPEIILADEPTGNLDTKSGKEVIDALEKLNKEGKTIIIITHDIAVARRCQRVVHILDGQIGGENVWWHSLRPELNLGQ